jgi:hypothetical protein
MDRAFFKFTLDTRVMIVGLALESLLDEVDHATSVRFLPREPKTHAVDADLDDPSRELHSRRTGRDASPHVRSTTADLARTPSRRDGRGRSEHLTPGSAGESLSAA